MLVASRLAFCRLGKGKGKGCASCSRCWSSMSTFMNITITLHQMRVVVAMGSDMVIIEVVVLIIEVKVVLNQHHDH